MKELLRRVSENVHIEYEENVKKSVATCLLEILGIGEPIFVRVTVDAANHRDREATFSVTDKGKMA